MPHLRYKADWYNKRIAQNSRFSLELISHIERHKETNFPWSNEELLKLPYQDIAEIAIPCVNKDLYILLGACQDFNDFSDVKCAVSQHRNNIKEIKKQNKTTGEYIATGKAAWTNSYMIRGTKGKKGALRIPAYNTILDKFEYFYIPAGSYDNTANFLEIVIETYTLPVGQKAQFTGVAKGNRKFWDCKVESFEAMCLANH